MRLSNHFMLTLILCAFLIKVFFSGSDKFVLKHILLLHLQQWCRVVRSHYVSYDPSPTSFNRFIQLEVLPLSNSHWEVVRYSEVSPHEGLDSPRLLHITFNFIKARTWQNGYFVLFFWPVKPYLFYKQAVA